MLVIIYYIAKDGTAFETEAACKSYNRRSNPEAYSHFVRKIWSKASAPNRPIPKDKLTVYRGGYLSQGVFKGLDFFTEADAREYEIATTETERTWRDYLKYAMPEDMITEYDELSLPELPSYGWIMWDKERPMPNTEIKILERHGRGTTISYDIYNGQDFVRAYHLDVIAWQPYDSKTDPPNDPWEVYISKHKLKSTDINFFKKLKK